MTTQTEDTRQDDYRQIADAMLTMIRMDSERAPASLDVESNHDGKSHVLIEAIHEHLFLVFEAIDFYAPDAAEMYVEMRLLADRQRAKREREQEADKMAARGKAENLHKLIHEQMEPWLTDSDSSMRDFAVELLKQADREYEAGRLVQFMRLVSKTFRANEENGS